MSLLLHFMFDDTTFLIDHDSWMSEDASQGVIFWPLNASAVPGRVQADKACPFVRPRSPTVLCSYPGRLPSMPTVISSRGVSLLKPTIASRASFPSWKRPA